MQAMFGLHNMPGVAAGRLHTRVGAIMASEDTFEIRIHGRGGHAARPEMVVDPIVAGAQIVLGLQSIVSRNVDPARSAVVSCTEFVTNGKVNEAGLKELKSRMPFIDLSKFEANPSVQNFPNTLTVEDMVRYVATKLAA